jgi:hypothetical protein
MSPDKDVKKFMDRLLAGMPTTIKDALTGFLNIFMYT